MFSSHQGLKCIWQLLKNTSEIWKNHIFTVSPGSSSIQVHWEFCCVFFQALYWITLSIKSSYFYAESLPWPVFRNLYVYTEKKSLVLRRCFSGSSMKFCGKKRKSHRAGFGSIVLGTCLLLGSSRCQLWHSNRWHYFCQSITGLPTSHWTHSAANVRHGDGK